MVLSNRTGLLFGTVRSEVRILSPRPIKSIIYGHQQWWPFLRCGKIVADPLTSQDPHGLNSSLFSSIRSMRVAAWMRRCQRHAVEQHQICDYFWTSNFYGFSGKPVIVLPICFLQPRGHDLDQKPTLCLFQFM